MTNPERSQFTGELTEALRAQSYMLRYLLLRQAGSTGTVNLITGGLETEEGTYFPPAV